RVRCCLHQIGPLKLVDGEVQLLLRVNDSTERADNFESLLPGDPRVPFEPLPRTGAEAHRERAARSRVPERIKNIGGFGARGSEVACRVPVSSRDVHRAACRAKSVCYLLSVVEVVVETNHVATADVTERPQLADFDE